MWAFVARRLLLIPPLAFGVCTLLFVLMHLAPGDASDYFFNPDMPPQAWELMRKNLGVDQPLYVQYGKWIRSSLLLDFGTSKTTFRPVSEMIAQRLPNTLILSGVSTVLLFATGILLGIISGVRPYTLLDNTLTGLSLFVYSMPSFWLALMLILLLSVHAGWFPASGMANVQAEA